MLRLLENPNLLEQEAFTEQLWAVFHLADELQYRIDLPHLSNSDYRSLAVTQDGRIERSTQSVEIRGAPLESVSVPLLPHVANKSV